MPSPTPPTLVLLLATACAHPTPPAPPASPASTTPPTAASPAPDAPSAPPSPAPLFAWPPPVASPEQIAEVRACAVDATAKTRYPKETGRDALAAAYAVQTACDQAVLAHACAVRIHDGEVAPAECVAAYRAAVTANPAYVWAGALPYAYPAAQPISAAPPLGAIAAIEVHYSWNGLGDPVSWSYTITDVAGTPKVQVTGAKAGPTPATLADDARRLPERFSGFVAIPAPVRLVDCYDNYPEWKATITFTSGKSVALDTRGANLIGIGGPWQMDLDGHTWLQTTGGLVSGLAGIADSLGLPFGQPMAWTCRGMDLFEGVYPPEEAAKPAAPMPGP